MEEEISYRVLRKIEQTEKNSPLLTKVNSNFYADLSKYLGDLSDRLNDENSSQKQMLMKDEIKNTKKIVMNIYEQREKKILLAAVSKVRGGTPDIKNMTNLEKKLFDTVLSSMVESRKNFLQTEVAENPSEKSKENAPTEEKTDEETKNPNPVVRVDKDIPEFVGTDEKKYNLRKGDIVSLPPEMSETLSKRGAAERIEL
jgi:DNA replication initiation complex subunit (GINS family)